MIAVLIVADIADEAVNRHHRFDWKIMRRQRPREIRRIIFHSLLQAAIIICFSLLLVFAVVGNSFGEFWAEHWWYILILSLAFFLNRFRFLWQHVKIVDDED